MNYLDRQIFPFAIDWNETIERNVTYDLRSTSLGFGAEFFTPTATYTVIGWDFSLLLQTGADILTFETFADSLVGMLQGFWLPCPLAAAKFSAGVSTTQFDVVAEDLTSTWNARPDQHLLLTYPDGTQRAGKISAVALNDGGETERVTLSATLAETPPAGTTVMRLHYVRFSSDTEEMDFLQEGAGEIKLSVLELPLEYTNAALGLQPLYLYHFWADTPVNKDWFYTSFAASVVSNGDVYSAFAMTHGQIKQTVDGNSNSVDITAQPDATHPFSMMAQQMPFGKILWCDISICYLAAPDTVTKIFSGFVTSVEDSGIDYIANCDSRLAWLKTKLPRFYVGTSCNHTLYEPRTCKVIRSTFETQVTATKITGGDPVQCTFNSPTVLDNWKIDDWFKGGICETGFGVHYEIRSIIKSHWNGTELELTLNADLNSADSGSLLQIVAGCDKSATTCANKFNNFQNFGAFVAVPDQNLSLKGLNTNVSQGGKKI